MARYKNTKTGAIVDSPFKLSGKDWEQVKNPGKGKANDKKQSEKQPDEDGADDE